MVDGDDVGGFVVADHFSATSATLSQVQIHVYCIPGSHNCVVGSHDWGEVR